MQAINSEARSSYDAAAGAVGGGEAEVLKGAEATLPEDLFVRLRRAGWLVSPVLEGWIGAEGGRVRLLGIDPMTAPPGTAAAEATLAGAGGAELAFLTGGALIAAPETAARLEADGRDVRAVEGLAPGTAFADIATAQRLLKLEGRLSRLVLLPEQPLGRPALEDLAPELIRQAPETGEDLARLTDSFHLNLTAFGLLSRAAAGGPDRR